MPHAVAKLGADDVGEVTEVLCDAFFDYPVMRFVLKDSGDRYKLHLHALISFFVTARAYRSEPILGVFQGDTLAAAALVSFPHRPAYSDALSELRNDLWNNLGRAARARYDAFSSACRPFFDGLRPLHLNMIGVLGTQQKRGLGRPLLEAVHSLSREIPFSEGVSLTTEAHENVCLYQHFGYEIVADARVESDLETWGMFRRD